jgi:hypothetical protein
MKTSCWHPHGSAAAKAAASNINSEREAGMAQVFIEKEE